MSDRASWDEGWRALAESELRGAPLASLAVARHDGLPIAPALGPDPARDEGLADAPRARALLVVTDRAEDVALAAGADGVWWRSAEPAPPQALLTETGRDPRIVETLSTTEAGTTRQSVVALTDVHESGGAAVTEVAVGVAAILELARRRSGPPPDFRLALAIGPELYLEIAKLRALRRLAARVLAAIEVDAPVWLAARTAERSLARLDVATNAVRATLGAAAAMLGGADVIGVLPMDALLGTASDLGARLARNTPQVLARESSLLAVDDPARGSFEIEALTDRIARDAWDVVREIERAGGLVAARALVRTRIERDAEARRAAVSTRRLPIVGVSKFPLETEAGLPGARDARDASGFEAARAAARVGVELVVVGAPEAVEARVAFVRELLAVGGLDVVPAGTGRAVVVCAPDTAFATEVPRVVREAAERGVPVVVAGRPGAHETALRHAGARAFVALGGDVLAFFTILRGGAS